jgi:hypothetical protein
MAFFLCKVLSSTFKVVCSRNFFQPKMKPNQFNVTRFLTIIHRTDICPLSVQYNVLYFYFIYRSASNSLWEWCLWSHTNIVEERRGYICLPFPRKNWDTSIYEQALAHPKRRSLSTHDNAASTFGCNFISRPKICLLWVKFHLFFSPLRDKLQNST